MWKKSPISNLQTTNNIKNSELKMNSPSSFSSSPNDTEYSNLETDVDIRLITELTDFLSSEAVELAINGEMNDESTTLTNLDALDYKPVSIVHLHTAQNNKVQQKPFMVLFNTRDQKSTVKA